VQFRNDEGTGQFIAAGLAVRAPLHLDEPIFTDDFRFLAGAVRTAVPKMTIPSPSMVLLRSGTGAVDRSVYPDLDEFWADLANAFADEIRALADAGCRYLQLDDTSLACLNDPSQREALAARGDDADHTHQRNIATINAALADRPAGMHIAAHVCRGNFRSSWVAEGGYDFVAEALFGELAVDGFFMEWDDARSGGFEPLRFVPKGKVVVLGLVTTKRGELETRDELRRRIEEASRYVDIDQLCLSPQCGFSSTVEGNALSAEQQADKLRLVVEVAEEVWGG
jgi:5-methyltetrahydropteroyltriglutamate--homocysteine methyltransferase